MANLAPGKSENAWEMRQVGGENQILNPMLEKMGPDKSVINSFNWGLQELLPSHEHLACLLTRCSCR